MARRMNARVQISRVCGDEHGGVAAGALKRAELADMRARTLVTYAALYGAVFDELSRRELLAQIQGLHAMLVQPAN